MSPIELAIFISRTEAICSEMGALLQRAAFSPNIKDRLDFSCALFDANGELFAQAAHIPVHLGSMAFAMADIVRQFDWQVGDMLVLNDPFLGGTHLPDVTMIAPVFVDDDVDDDLIGFVANRAHHANIGSDAPGSMPLSRSLDEEGLIIPPTLFMKNHELLEAEMARISSTETFGDFAAQISANQAGVARLIDHVGEMSRQQFDAAVSAVNEYGNRLAQSALAEIPNGVYRFNDVMDGNGFGLENIELQVEITVAETIKVDFSGTSPQVEGNINCPLSVAAASVIYAFRCLMPEQTPNCHGTYQSIEIYAPKGCLINAERPAGTAAGNVETSMRLVDLIFGALAQALPERIPAASQGTMNNVAMGNHQVAVPWDYYETMAGGAGAGPNQHGAAAIHSHMTNTLNTPIESLESHYPIRVSEYSVRTGTGGAGQYPGGDGLVREFTFLAPAEVTLLTERRTTSPWGLAGGSSGQRGFQSLDGKQLPSKVAFEVTADQVLRIETPGGGGFGEPKA